MDIDVIQPAPPPSPALLRSPTSQSGLSHLSVPGSHTVTVPNTRQKSCNACVAGKRGCDKKEPTCSRCAARKIPCVYRRRRAPSPGSDSGSDQASATDVSAVEASPVELSIPRNRIAQDNLKPQKNCHDLVNAVGTQGEGEDEDDTTLALRLQHPLSNVSDPVFGSVMGMDLDNLTTISPQPAAFGPHELALLPSGSSPPSLLPASSDSSLYHPPSSSSSSPSSSLSSSGSPPNPTVPFSSSEPTFDETMLDYSILDVLPGLDSAPMESDAWLNQCSDFPDLPALEMRQLAYRPEPDMCDMALEQVGKCPKPEGAFFKPWELKDPRTRIGCMMDNIKHLPAVFARTRATPFLHPELYRTRQPRAITHAWTACTVYTARTPDTEAWATRVLFEGSSAVLRSPPLPLHQDPNAYTAVGRLDTHSLLDRLAAVQALLLYQIIRCFDGDLALMSHAERDSETLLDWALELAKARNQLEDEGFGGTVASMPSGQTIAREAPVSWENWVLLECVRRTVIKALCVTAAFACLRNRHPPCCVFEDRNTFTMSRHMWAANTSANFYYAWRNKSQFVITRMKFDDVLQHIHPDDVCDFSLPFMKIKLGVDVIESFMLSVPPAMDIYSCVN